jgi:hypothetical protein
MDTDVRGVIQYGEMCIKYAMQRRKERKNEGAHWEDGCAAGKTLLVPLEMSGRVARSSRHFFATASSLLDR